MGSRAVIGPQPFDGAADMLIQQATALKCEIHTVTAVVEVDSKGANDASGIDEDIDTNADNASLITVNKIHVLGTFKGDALEFKMPLNGDHQRSNMATALKAMEVFSMAHPEFPLSLERIRSGIEQVRWPGRMQWLELTPGGTKILIDGAHNEDSAC